MKNIIVPILTVLAISVAVAVYWKRAPSMANERLLPDAIKAQVISAILSSRNADENSIELLSGVVSGLQTYEARVSIIGFNCEDISEDNTIGCRIEIGIDDLTDEDSGWNIVWAIEAKMSISVEKIIIHSATATPLAG